jgi:iron-sulfur cluster insertion protein
MLSRSSKLLKYKEIARLSPISRVARAGAAAYNFSIGLAAGMSVVSVRPRSNQMINVSPTAASKINELLVEEGKAGSGLRVFVQGGGCSGFQYGLMIEEGGGDADQVFESNGVRLFVDPVSISYLKGAEVDFVDTVTGGGFTIKNPNATSTCGCGSSFSV